MSYRLSPLKLGAEVFGCDLNQVLSAEMVEKIKSDLWRHRLLVFRGEGIVAAERQLQIARWFGDIDNETFYKHPKSPSPEIFRVSNVESEGCRQVGRTGWHIDGSFQPCPYAVSVYHMVNVPKSGDTRFVGLNEVLSSLSAERRKFWERLWMLSDRRGGLAHPLVYSHPITGEATLCFHLGMTATFLLDKGSPNERELTEHEAAKILQEIHDTISQNDEELVYSHRWKIGDFILSDNLAVGHEASPDSQLPFEQVGLRVLHRVTVKGTHQPTKEC